MTTVTQAEQTVRETIVAGLIEAAVNGAAEKRNKLKSVLAAGETLEDWYDAETQVPLVVRLLPFVPDLLTRPKKFVLVLTPARLIIVRMTNPFNRLKESEVKEVVAAFPWSEVAEITPRRGTFTSSVTVRTQSGRRFAFKNMLRSDPEDLAETARRLSQLKPSR